MGRKTSRGAEHSLPPGALASDAAKYALIGFPAVRRLRDSDDSDEEQRTHRRRATYGIVLDVSVFNRCKNPF